MLSKTPILLLLLFTLLAAAVLFPQEGNQQFDLHNKYPSYTLAPSIPAPTAAAATAAPSTAHDLSVAVATKAPKKNVKQPITGDDGTKLGMAAATQGIGTATGALSGLPLAGNLGGLGARDESNIQSQNQRRTPLVPGLGLANKLPIIGSLAGGLGGRDTSNLGKREAQIGGDLLGKLPFLGGLFNTELEDAERTVRPENTSFPPGIPVKTPQGALGERADDREERRTGCEQEDAYGDIYPVAHPHKEQH
ncbi:hypothetical protein HOY80DRAFT_1045988 [Tuber brumale]|nr:hypothetical protein HOY80DRAFT_1045988 [Tuber brumale]